MEEELLAMLTDIFKYAKSCLKDSNGVYLLKVETKVMSSAEDLLRNSENFQSVCQPNIIYEYLYISVGFMTTSSIDTHLYHITSFVASEVENSN